MEPILYGPMPADCLDQDLGVIAAAGQEIADLRFDLAAAYVRAGRTRAARRELLEAKRLDPREPRLEEALAALRGGSS